MTKRILVVEDNKRDAGFITSIASEYGTPTTVDSIGSAMSVLESRTNWDVLILDLKMPDSDPSSTIDAIQLLNLQAPIVVVTGWDDPKIKQRCESLGWSWINKDTARLSSALHHALRTATETDESGDSYRIPQSGTSQLKAILAMLQEVKQEQQKTNARLGKIESAVDVVLTQMYGPQNEVTGFRSGGCVATCERTQGMFSAGGKWVSAVWIATASAFGGGLVSLVFWFVLKVIQ